MDKRFGKDANLKWDRKMVFGDLHSVAYGTDVGRGGRAADESDTNAHNGWLRIWFQNDCLMSFMVKLDSIENSQPEEERQIKQNMIRRETRWFGLHQTDTYANAQEARRRWQGGQAKKLTETEREYRGKTSSREEATEKIVRRTGQTGTTTRELRPRPSTRLWKESHGWTPTTCTP